MTLESLSENDRITKCPKHLFQNLIQPCDEDIWQVIKKDYSPINVFVNVPYIEEYNELKATIIALLLVVKLNPILAAERSQGQPIRLCKICELMQTCKYVVTDLSYDTLHNIPFELGFFLALGRKGHSMVLIDYKYHEKDGIKMLKFDSRLSNLKGLEVIKHERNTEKLITGLVNRLRYDVPEAKIPKRIRQGFKNKVARQYQKVSDALQDGSYPEFITLCRAR